MGRPRKNFPATPTQSALKKLPVLARLFDVNTETDLFWDALLKRFSKTARVYGFSRVEAPIIEDLKLYRAFYGNSPMSGSLFSSGADLVLSFPWENAEAGLRPSQLPGLFRNFFQAKLHDAMLLHKWHYSGFTAKMDFAGGKPVLDYEFGCEILGAFNHLNEAQAIATAWEFLSGLGLEGLVLEINNLGSAACQERYNEVLVDFLQPKKYELCENCNELLNLRPLAVFACEKLDCQSVLAESPTILDFLDQDSSKDFTYVLEALDEMRISYQLNPFYASSLPTEKTNFTIKGKYQDKLLVLAEGGHHGSLAQAVSGKSVGAFGFFGSLSVIRKAMEASNEPLERLVLSEVCLVPLGELAAKRSLRLFRDLTAEKIMVYDHFGLSGVKNQLKAAQDNKVPIALIMGQKEAMDEMVILRDVKSGMQEIISYDKIVEEVKKRLGK